MTFIKKSTINSKLCLKNFGSSSTKIVNCLPALSRQTDILFFSYIKPNGERFFGRPRGSKNKQKKDNLNSTTTVVAPVESTEATTVESPAEMQEQKVILTKNYCLVGGITLEDYLNNPINEKITCLETCNNLTLAVITNGFEALVDKKLVGKQSSFVDKYTGLIDPEKVKIAKKGLLNYKNLFNNDLGGVKVDYTKTGGFG